MQDGVNIDCEFGPDGQTAILKYKDGRTQEIKMIAEDEEIKYIKMVAGRYHTIFIAIARVINLYSGNFLKEVNVYRRDNNGYFIFYKKK